MDIQIHDKIFTKFISDKEIESKVFELSKKIEKDYKEKKPVFICVLNGSFIFASDLVKNINIDLSIEFIKVSSYQGTLSTGKISKSIGLNIDITDRDIVFVEDIIDTGNTMSHLLKEFSILKPKSIKIASLVVKPDVFLNQFEIDYLGFSIPNKFIVGYGLDYDGLGRNLKEIYQLKS